MTTTGAIAHQPKPRSLPFVALPKATLTDNALVYSDQPPTFEEWQAHGKALQQCSGAALWWVGDWFVYGENRFGEEAYQAVGDYEPETVRKAVWVSSRVPLRHRTPLLSWKHHDAVASQEPADQVKWLGLAVEHQLTTRELYASIKAGRVVSQSEIDAQKTIAPALVDVELVFHDPKWQRFVKQQWADRNNVPSEEKRRWLEALREPARMAAELEKELAK
jgi:hypothetical protein